MFDVVARIRTGTSADRELKRRFGRGGIRSKDKRYRDRTWTVATLAEAENLKAVLARPNVGVTIQGYLPLTAGEADG